MLLAVIPDPITSVQFWSWVGVAAHSGIQLLLVFRVVMKKRQPAETLAWVMVIFLFPIVGPAIYLIFGERWLGRRRERRFVDLTPPTKQWLATLPEAELPMPRQFARDVRVIARRDADERIRLTIEVLVLED